MAMMFAVMATTALLVEVQLTVTVVADESVALPERVAHCTDPI
jgi:hypothetical protein